MANILDRLNTQTAQYMGLPKVPPKGQFTTQWKATPAQRMMQNEAALSRQMANDQVLRANIPAQFRNQIVGRGPLFNFGTRTGAGASGLPDPRAQANPGAGLKPGSFGTSNPQANPDAKLMPGSFGANKSLGDAMWGRPRGLASKGGGLGASGGGGGGGGSSSAGASRPSRPGRGGGGGSKGSIINNRQGPSTPMGPKFGRATGANPDYKPGDNQRTNDRLRKIGGSGSVSGATGTTSSGGSGGSGVGSVSMPMRNTQFNAMSGPGEKTMQGENVRVGQKSTQPGFDVGAFWKKKKSGPGSKGSKGSKD